MPKYMTVKDVAELVGTTPQTIRNLEERQIIDPPRRNHNGRRYYTLDDAQRIYSTYRPIEMGAEPFSQRWNQWIDGRKEIAVGDVQNEKIVRKGD